MMDRRSPDYVCVHELESLLGRDGTIMLVDARSPEEYDAGHMPGSINVPIGSLVEMIGSDRFAGAGLVVTLCGSTGRGEQAAGILRAEGVKGVKVLRGGLKAWREAGYPIE